MPTHCLIVDDEPLATEIIQAHLNKFNDFEVLGVCHDAFEAMNFLRENKVDLMFLDINMPEMKGTDFLRNFPKPPKVIFTTAYREYALESYELNVIDYLLKPISFQRFMQAINKFIELKSNSGTSNEISYHKSEKQDDEFIYVREKNQVHKLLTCNISHIESLSDYVKIYCSDNAITIRHTITSLEKLLPQSSFMRIHRSFIVNLKHISSFTTNSIFIKKKELPIGPVFRNEVFKKLNYEKFSDEK